MLIPYLVNRGSFRPKFDVWLAEHNLEVAEGAGLKIKLGKTWGYPAHDLHITISQEDQSFFNTDWEFDDWTRFPARIRAVATSLRDHKLWGIYLVFSDDGEVVLEK